MSRPSSPGDHSTRAGVGLLDGFADDAGDDGFAGASGVRDGDAGPGASGVRDGTSIRTGGAPCPSVPAGCTVHPAAPAAAAPSAASTAMPFLPMPLPLMPLPRTPAPRRPAAPVLPGRSSPQSYPGRDRGGRSGHGGE
ncbi:hypothetical protein GCM10019016_067800 [Streptomyces prasinosporus]|uniref:Uncharacterized protein n=1 Tax=Streptomyces prasinosporus TaxID=68256 RepID=A0ABP6U027_9ACTN|nr:hypothetical protein GCM10010332_54260 [Streptomyces albogriseolus]